MGRGFAIPLVYPPEGERTIPRLLNLATFPGDPLFVTQTLPGPSMAIPTPVARPPPTNGLPLTGVPVLPNVANPLPLTIQSYPLGSSFVRVPLPLTIQT